MRLKENRHGITKSAAQFSLMITINEEDRTLGLRIIKISGSNPDTETRTTRHPTDRLASTQIGTKSKLRQTVPAKPTTQLLGQQTRSPSTNSV